MRVTRRKLVALAVIVTIPVRGIEAQRVGPPSRLPQPTTGRAAAAHGVIDGVVSDTALRPVSFAEVVVFRTGISLQADVRGRFRFTDVPAGEYLLIVRRLGFRPVSAIVQVSARDTLRLAYTMEPALSVLDSVIVTEEAVSVRMLEFERRRKEGRGFFITREQIERRNLPVSLDYLRLAPAVTLTPSHNASGLSQYVAISRREGGSFIGDGAGACALQVVLDGVPMPPRFPLEMLPPPREIAGIEVYAGPSSVPPQFSGVDRRCGMIIVWTRDR